MPVVVSFVGKWDGKDLARARSEMSAFEKSTQGVGDKMQNFGRATEKIGKKLTTFVTLPLVGLGAAAVKGFADFDAALTQSTAIMGNVSEQTRDRMSKAAREVATSLNISHKAAAESFYFLASAGLDAEQSIAALPQVAAFAKAGMFDMATATDLATDAQSALGLTSDDASVNLANLTRVTDVFVKANTLANASVEQFSQSITSKAGVALKNANKSIEEGVSVLSVFADQGIKGEAAGTLLARTLEGLQDNARKNSAAFAEFNVQVYDANGSMRPMVDIVKDLEVAFAGMSDEERNAALAKMGFNKLAKQGILALLGNSDALSEYEAGLISAGGTAQEVAEKQLETFNEKLGLLGKQFADIAIDFGPIIIDQFLVPLGEKVRAVADRIAALTPQQRQMAVTFAAIAAAIGPVLLVVGKLIVAVGSIVKMFAAFTLAGSLLAIKIIAVVAAIALIVAAFKLAWDNSATLRNAVQQLWQVLQNLGNLIRNTVVNTFKSLAGETNSVGNVFRTIGQYLGAVFTVVVNAVTTAVRILGNVFQVQMKIIEVAAKVLTMVANIIRGVLMLAIDVLMNKLGPFSAKLRSIASGVQSAFRTVASVVTAAFNNVGKAVETFINFGIKAVNALIDAYNKLAQFLPGVTQATRIAEFRFNSLSGAAQSAATSTYNAGSTMSATGREALRLANNADRAGESAGAFSSKADKAADSAVNFGEAMGGSGGKGGGKSAAKGADKAAESLKKYDKVFDAHLAKLRSAREKIEADYKSMFETVSRAITSGLNFEAALPEYDEAGERVGMSFMEKLNEQANKAVAFAAKIKELIALGLKPEALSMVVQAGVDAGTKIADELIGGGVDAINDTNRLVDTTKEAGDEIGLEAAETFYGTGLKLATQAEEAFVKHFGKGGPGYGKLNKLMTHLAKSMERTTTITVVTRHQTEGVPGRRMGGPVAAGNPYVVGEAGPELFVPTVTGRIIPNHDLRSSMTGRGGGAVSAAGGSMINVTVNAGLGTSGAEVGRQIVDAIKQYERRNGSVYVSAS
jgi:TP901 family phage tail tape measure protein